MSEAQVVHSKSPVFYERFTRKPELQHQTHYCPGCGHGNVHKLVAEALEELGLQDRAVFISPVGCAVFAYYYFDVGNIQVAHGRAPAAATAVRRARPESIVISYQGDGDLAAIGAAEILHAANRGEPIAVFFVNNAIYGMTGGQMAPTTLIGQMSTTTPWGRRPANEGFPLRMAELLATLEAPVYIERVALSDNKNIMRARKAVRKALELQRDAVGFTFVEILSPCPTIWRMDPTEARDWVKEKMIPNFPLAVFRDRPAPVSDDTPEASGPPRRSVAELLSLETESATAEVRGSRCEAQTPEAAPRELGVKVAGFGGQGVLLLGQILAQMGMRKGLEVSWLPSYGPEMRSGSAHCHVRLSTARIGSPLIAHPVVLIAMNEISLRKFSADVVPGGVILYNREALPAGFEVKQARTFCLPAAEMADRLGAAKAANMVMLGALLELVPWLDQAAALAVLESSPPWAGNAELLEINRRALAAGRQACVEKLRSEHPADAGHPTR